MYFIAEKGKLDFGLGYSTLADDDALKGGGAYCFRFQSSALIHSRAVNVFPIFFHFQISYPLETCTCNSFHLGPSHGETIRRMKSMPPSL